MTTYEIKHAKIGEISHGTLRTEDLLPCFMSELEGLCLLNGDWLSRDHATRDRFANLIGEAQDAFADDGEALRDPDNAYYTVEALEDALQEFAPPYCYFGSHPGDGACFGFWPDIDGAREDCPTFADGADVPEDHEGEWVHVNDHGNVTLYVREGGRDREVWSIV